MYSNKVVALCGLFALVGALEVKNSSAVTSWTRAEEDDSAWRLKFPMEIDIMTSDNESTMAYFTCESGACKVGVFTRTSEGEEIESACSVRPLEKNVDARLDAVSILRKDRVLVTWLTDLRKKIKGVISKVIRVDDCGISDYINLTSWHSPKDYGYFIVPHGDNFDILYYDLNCGGHYCNMTYTVHDGKTLPFTIFSTTQDDVILRAVVPSRNVVNADFIAGGVRVTDAQVLIYSTTFGWEKVGDRYNDEELQFFYSNVKIAVLCWKGKSEKLSCNWFEMNRDGESRNKFTRKLILDNKSLNVLDVYSNVGGHVIFVSEFNGTLLIDKSIKCKSNDQCKRLAEIETGADRVLRAKFFMNDQELCIAYVTKARLDKIKNTYEAHYEFHRKCIKQEESSAGIVKCGSLSKNQRL